MSDEYVSERADLPAIRIVRDAQNAIDVQLDEAEWQIPAEMRDLSTYLAPMLDVFVDFESKTRWFAGNTPLSALGDTFVEMLQDMRALGVLKLDMGRWRYTDGPYLGRRVTEMS